MGEAEAAEGMGSGLLGGRLLSLFLVFD